MKAIMGNKGMFAEGKRLEQSGQLQEAAAVYQKAVDGEPDNQEAVARLLVVYRRLKDYGRELAVIDAALKAYEQRSKTSQEKWIRDHPKAAGTGRAIFRQLGGTGDSALGTDPAVDRLLKRKVFVQKRVAAGKGKKRRKGVTGAAKAKKPAADSAAQRREKQRKEAQERKEAAAAARQQAHEQRRQEETARKAEKLEAKRVAAAAKKNPSLFVISLRYLSPLEEIDAAMPRHLSFLDDHYKKGDFLVSGRQVPRTGGIIIARGKDRNAVERMMKQDPFVKQKLASVDIVEFSASRVGKGWRSALT
jgi:uncharacterized protein YciI